MHINKYCALFPHMTVRENIARSLRMNGCLGPRRRRRSFREMRALPPLPLREHLHELLLVVHAQLVVGVLAVELHGSLGDE